MRLTFLLYLYFRCGILFAFLLAGTIKLLANIDEVIENPAGY